ncbi:MAG: hypothetical protein QM775_01890 [Pirellulales bacterium]
MAVVGGAGVWKFAPASWKPQPVAPLTGTVVVDKFVHEIVERGDIKSSANVEVRSEVQLRGNGGVAILEIVPEGTFVEEGDFLCRLDASSLQDDLTLQEIDTNSSQANVIGAQTGVETAKLSLSEYESGTFKQQEEQMQSEIFVAEENFRRAQEYVRYSERLASKGYVTPIQLEADRFAVEKAEKELEVSRTKLDVLRNFTEAKDDEAIGSRRENGGSQARSGLRDSQRRIGPPEAHQRTNRQVHDRGSASGPSGVCQRSRLRPIDRRHPD